MPVRLGHLAPASPNKFYEVTTPPGFGQKG
jgi:hypothetical protein